MERNLNNRFCSKWVVQRRLPPPTATSACTCMVSVLVSTCQYSSASAYRTPGPAFIHGLSTQGSSDDGAWLALARAEVKAWERDPAVGHDHLRMACDAHRRSIELLRTGFAEVWYYRKSLVILFNKITRRKQTPRRRDGEFRRSSSLGRTSHLPACIIAIARGTWFTKQKRTQTSQL